MRKVRFILSLRDETICIHEEFTEEELRHRFGENYSMRDFLLFWKNSLVNESWEEVRQ